MTTYFIITGFSDETRERAALLEAACRQRGIVCTTMESTTADRLALPTLRPGDALYNATRGGMRLEELLWRPGVATFYNAGQPPRGIQDTTRWLAPHARAELPQPQTINHTTADKELLEHYAAHLGGFPLVVKVAGGSRGTGVMRVDSLPALFSLTDYLASSGAEFVLRQYINSDGVVRLFVVGSNVVGTLKNPNRHKDFRTNLGLENEFALTSVSEEVQQTAIQAVHAVGVELGGVDMIIDRAGKHFLLEMNFPAGFAKFPSLGVDVPGRIVEHLAAKAARLATQ